MYSDFSSKLEPKTRHEMKRNTQKGSEMYGLVQANMFGSPVDSSVIFAAIIRHDVFEQKLASVQVQLQELPSQQMVFVLCINLQVNSVLYLLWSPWTHLKECSSPSSPSPPFPSLSTSSHPLLIQTSFPRSVDPIQSNHHHYVSPRPLFFISLHD